ncbi:MAG: hypothetical protein HXY24_13465, partial [Rubrivivax sp.]|nr:hypothetical protein [Rubrivivax sp.]
MKRFTLANSWPAILFTISYVAAVALVIQANRSFGEGSAPVGGVSPPGQAATKPDPFSPLDDLDAERTGGSHTPLLLTDFGEQFDVDHRTKLQRRGLLQLVDRVTEGIDRVRQRSETRRRLEGRDAREAGAGSRFRINWFDRNRPGAFLGMSDLDLPSELGSLPPLPPSTSWDLGGGSVLGSGRRLDIQIDPRLFRDEQAMAEFIARLRTALVSGGLEPQFQVTDQPGGGRTLAPTAPLVVSRPVGGPLVP